MNARRLLIVAICAVVSATSLHIIVRSLRQSARSADRTIGLAEQQGARICRDRATAERGHNLAAIDG